MTTTPNNLNGYAQALTSDGMRQLAHSHGMREFDESEVDALMDTPTGVELATRLVHLMWNLEQANSDVARHALDLQARSTAVLEAVKAGQRIEPAWVEQSARDLAAATATRQTTVDAYRGLVTLAELLTGE